MNRLATGRLVALSLTVLLAAGLGAVVTVAWYTLGPAAFVSGWILFTLVVILSLYNLRKKLPIPPIGKSATWLHFHVYLGLLSVVLFGMHIKFQVPRGPFEVFLAAMFLTVAGSGVIGLIYSRVLPGRLADRQYEVIFERIPLLYRRVQDQAHKLVLEAIDETETTTIADLYCRRLAGFFERPRYFWHHLFNSSRPRNILLSELKNLDRYLNDHEREIAGQMLQLVNQKDDLDYHRAQQGTLKGWLFVHIGLTYSLWVLVITHVVLVHLFWGGMR